MPEINELPALAVPLAGTSVFPADQGSTTYSVTAAQIATYVGSAFAPINSPAFTGTPTAPTAAPATNTTQIATTAFVIAEIATIPSGGDVVGPASSTAGRVAVYADTTGKLLQNGTKLEADLVTGPASSTSGGIPTYNGTGGKTLQDSANTFITTATDFLANTANRVPTVAALWASGTPTALTPGASVAVDMSLGINFSLTISTSGTLAAPTNTKVGQSGVFIITQAAGGGNTLAFNAVYKFPGGTDPTITVTASAIDVISYYVVSSTVILCVATQAFA